MRLLNFLRLSLIISIIVLSSCAKEESPNNIQLPTVETVFQRVIGTYAYCGGNVSSKGSGQNPSRGIQWNYSSNPLNYENEVYHQFIGEGIFELVLKNLPQDTIIYFRAFAENEAGRVYGEELSARTTMENPNGAYINSRGCVVCENYEVGDYFNLDTVEYLVVGNPTIRKEVNNLELRPFCTSKVSSMSRLFKDKMAFKEDIGNWDVSNVNDMSYMFFYAVSFNQDISDWCVDKFSSQPSQFSTASALTNVNSPVWGTCPI